MWLHLIGENAPEAPFSEAGMELAGLLHCGVAIAGFVALLLHGATAWVSAVGAILAFVVLSVALYHRIARWVSVAIGSAFSVTVGAAVGGLARSEQLGVWLGAAAGLLLAGVVYGRLVVAAVRARRLAGARGEARR